MSIGIWRSEDRVKSSNIFNIFFKGGLIVLFFVIIAPTNSSFMGNDGSVITEEVFSMDTRVGILIPVLVFSIIFFALRFSKIQFTVNGSDMVFFYLFIPVALLWFIKLPTIQLNQNTTIVAQATSQSSQEFLAFANIMLNAGVDPNSPYSAISFDTMMLAALALQHQSKNNISQEDLSKSLVSVANPPGIVVGPGNWETARSLLLRGIEINYEGVSGSVDFDINGDVEGMYSLNQVTPDNVWSVKPLEKFHPFKPRIIID